MTTVLHALAGPAGPELDPPIVARITCEVAAFEDAARGLPDGAAIHEAVAARIDGIGGGLAWGEPERVPDASSLLRTCRARGVSSIEMMRADPTLVPRMQVGSFLVAGLRHRALRRTLLRAPSVLAPRSRSQYFLRTAADVAFWSGVRSVATRAEWERLTRSSYVVLYYHRIAGEAKPEQKRLDVAPDVFERQVKWLRRLGVKPISADELVAFHYDVSAKLPRRAFVLAADDGFRDAVAALSRHVDLLPYCFVPTSAVGATATWIDGRPQTASSRASWDWPPAAARSRRTLTRTSYYQSSTRVRSPKSSDAPSVSCGSACRTSSR